MRSFVFACLVAFATAAPTKPDGETLQCYDLVDPFTNEHRAVDCLRGSKLRRRGSAAAGVAPSATASSVPALPSSSGTPNRFNVTYNNCTATGERADDWCPKVKAIFDTATSILSDILIISNNVSIKAQLMPFCANGTCNCESDTGFCEKPTSLGSAASARMISLQDDDGQIRLYPQAVVKQMGLTGIDYAEHDILAWFNTNSSLLSPTKYYLPGDPLPMMGVDIEDYQVTIIHELIHGLGFNSAYRQLNADILIPQPSSDTGLAYENEFDRFLLDNNGTYLSQSIVQPLNALFNQSSNATIDKQIDELGAKALALGTTAKSVSFATRNGTSRYLETSYRPFRQGSSFTHLSYDVYTNASDFLMCPHPQERAGNLKQRIASTNGLLSGEQLNNSTLVEAVDLRLAVGPGIKAILQSVGWTLRSDADFAPKRRNPW